MAYCSWHRWCSYKDGEICPKCQNEYNAEIEKMSTCKHGYTGNCELCLKEMRNLQNATVSPPSGYYKNNLDIRTGADRIAEAVTNYHETRCQNEAQKAASALAMQIGGEHYKSCKIQPVQFIEANALGFLEGCVVKRLARHNKPTGKGRQDIEKAIHELQLILELRYPTS